VLLISQDVVGETMAGPGIRYHHLARVLASHLDVVLAIPDESPPEAQERTVVTVRYTRRDWPTIESLVGNASVVVCPSDVTSDFPQLAESRAFLVVDGYDPLLAEWLALSSTADAPTQQAQWWDRMCELNQQYLSGDFYICATERQRDWWLGLLEANGRINPWTFRDDPTLRKLIAVVPYGLPEATPQHSRPVLRGIWPGIDQNDRIILWGGGLWPWLDPVTAVHAVAQLQSKRRDIRLVFPGTTHPNPWMQDMPTRIEATRTAAQETGLLDDAVFFTDWLPYRDWANALMESDIALALALDTLETRLAFRSRVLEYIWAGLPIITTPGDASSDLVSRYQLGEVVNYQDPAGVAQAIDRVLELPREACGLRAEQVRRDFSWEQVAQPLIEYCLHPWRAADKEALDGQVGPPFYLEEQRRLGQQRDTLIQDRDFWKELVKRYEQGRFMRLMKWADRCRRSLRIGT
jgi:glycosyltransferase involved in cell wall biosynthesis